GENFARAGVDGFVERIKGHAPEVIYERFYEGDEVDGGGGAGKRVNPEFAGFFDMVFVDATKMEYASYARAVWPLVRAGGLVVADNFLSHRGEMEGLLKEMADLGDLEATGGTFLLPIDNGLLFCFKGLL
ncbi:hypothetical protein KJ835_02045, partial [Patescibacteria group bacterium]|nr:hypothetical protein [Patescibacteria group bacterium]